MKQNVTSAIILRRINYGEADRILTVITPDYGKVSLLAKGVRKSKSRLAGGLELFSVTTIGYIDGKSDLKTVISTQLVRYYGKIVDNVGITMLAYEFLRLVDVHTQDSCDSDYFTLLENGLQSLTEYTDHPDIVYVWFVHRLLQLGGSGLNLERQVNGESFDEDTRYQFSFDDMGFQSQSNGKFSPKHIKFLRLLAKVSTPSNLIQVADAKQLATELKPLLEHCVKLLH